MLSQMLHQQLIQLNIPSRILVAYSGGVDSHVLLHALANLHSNLPELQIRVIHVDHRLSPNSQDWAHHCQKICQQLGVEFILSHIPKDAYIAGKSLEAVARDFRYQAFATLLEPGECLMTGHNQDDQAETLLLQLFRGAGVKGLAAMPVLVAFKNGLFARPMLGISRSIIKNYAEHERLQWIEDESNLSINFDRNYLRQHIFPSLSARWPAIQKVVARTATHCAESAELLDELAQQDLAVCVGSVSGTLAVSSIKKLSIVRQKNLLRYWLRTHNLPVPSTIKLQHIQTDILNCRSDAVPLVAWEGCQVRRFQNDIYAMSPLQPHDNKQFIFWDIRAPLVLPSGLGILTAKPSAAMSNVQLTENTKVIVKFRCGGERFHPEGRSGSHPLKKLLQEWQVPPWQRERIPLIYVENELIAVVGYALAKSFGSPCEFSLVS